MPNNQWSPMRVWTVGLAGLATAVVGGCFAAQQVYTGKVVGHPVLWMVGLIAVVLWISFLAAFVRDEVAKMLEPIVIRLDVIETDIDEYGDNREAQGQAVAARAINGRHLTSVD